MSSVLELLYEGRGIVIEGDEVVLGRVKSCTLRVVHPLVSRQHCRISLASNGIFVEDMGSSNGTFVNGDRVRGREQVRAGDRVTLGRGGAELTIVGAEIDGEDIAGFDPEVARATLVAGDPRAQAFRARVTVDSQALPQLEMDEVVESSILEDQLANAQAELDAGAEADDYGEYDVTEPAQLSTPQPAFPAPPAAPPLDAGYTAYDDSGQFDQDPLELSSSQEIQAGLDADSYPEPTPLPSDPGFHEEPTQMVDDLPPGPITDPASATIPPEAARAIEQQRRQAASPPPPPPPPPGPSEPRTQTAHPPPEDKTEAVSAAFTRPIKPAISKGGPLPEPPPPPASPAPPPRREPAAAAESAEGGTGLGFLVGLLVGLLVVAVLAVATQLPESIGDALPGWRILRVGGDDAGGGEK